MSTTPHIRIKNRAKFLDALAAEILDDLNREGKRPTNRIFRRVVGRIAAAVEMELKRGRP